MSCHCKHFLILRVLLRACCFSSKCGFDHFSLFLSFCRFLLSCYFTFYVSTRFEHFLFLILLPCFHMLYLLGDKNEGVCCWGGRTVLPNRIFSCAFRSLSSEFVTRPVLLSSVFLLLILLVLFAAFTSVFSGDGSKQRIYS